MNQKLTLSIEDSAIKRGKSYAAKQGKSLSSIVEQFLFLLECDTPETEILLPVSEKLSSLVGISGSKVTEADYRRHRINRNNG